MMDSLHRLKRVIRKKIGKKKFVVVSHTEPYMHYYSEGQVRWRKAAGGLVTALDPVMQVCKGTWVAYGAGDADADASSPTGRVKVPPNDAQYVLQRVALSKDELVGYLDGAAHSALWPWCHFAYVRPVFDDDQWEVYREVNRRFADAVVRSVGKKPAFVWLNDYHLALAAQYIKQRRPDIVTAQFWHVPWPHVELFKICPWGREILEAMLYNDLVGFQIRNYANNFLDSVDQTLQARVDREQSSIYYKKSRTSVRRFPISIDYHAVRKAALKVSEPQEAALRRHLGLVAPHLVVSVDRLDYAKGLSEKMATLDAFFSNHPQWRGRLTLVQVASPTRSSVPAYRYNTEQVRAQADAVNYRWGEGDWKPVVLLNSFVAYPDVVALYRMADVCWIHSLHDGMNLVAKEYVAAKTDGDGVLLLSRFTGASREMPQAVPVNPYALNDSVRALKHALELPLPDRRKRMEKLSREIQEHDVYAWAADFIGDITRLESTVI